jgi:DNA-binding winged helix-turn-helix (wHTH) protein
MLYQLGPYTLNTEFKTLVRSTDQELVCDADRLISTLILLIEHHPRIVTKEQLFEAVWPNDIVSENSVVRLLSDLRKVLASFDSNTQYIITVPKKGYRLMVPVTQVANIVKTESDFSTPAEIATDLPMNKKRQVKKLPAAILIGISFFLIVILFNLQAFREEKNPVNGLGKLKIYEPIDLPIMNDWYSSPSDLLITEKDHIKLIPTGEFQYLATEIKGPGFFQNAIISATIVVDETFVKYDQILQPFVQLGRDQWPGDWDCWKPFKLKANTDIEIKCWINEPENLFTLTENDLIRFGIRTNGGNSDIKGSLIIKQASLQLPPALPVSSGWSSSNNVAITYQGGVRFSPKSKSDSIYYRFQGPIDLTKSVISFTIDVDQAFIDTGADLQPFVRIENTDRGVWSCWIDNEKITTGGFTWFCTTDYVQPPLNIVEDQIVAIGIQAYGNTIKGKIGILGVTIIDASLSEF